MKVVSSFKHLEHTEALDQKINEKSQKLKKYLDGNFEVHWTCSANNQQVAEIKVVGPNFEHHASAESDSLYKSLDLVINKVEKQLQKQKEKWKNHIGQKHNSPLKNKIQQEDN